MTKKIILFSIISLIISACSTAPTAPITAIYKTLVIERTEQTLLSEYSARLSGRQVVEVRPQVSGQITQILIEEGQKVHKGQTLFIIDQVPYQAALKEAEATVKNAEAQLATAKLNLESTEMLHENNVVRDYDLQSARNNCSIAEASLMQAQAQELNARNNLSYTTIKSPVDGVAGMISYRVGALVSSSSSEPLVTVADDNVIYAYFSMTEGQILDLTENYGSTDALIRQMPDVSLRMNNGKIYAETGRVGAVSGIVSSGTNAVTIRADFANNQGVLKDGGSGAVIVPTQMKDCIVIPQSATFELQDKIFAYKVVNSKATSVQIKVYRLNNGTDYVVESGLAEGDTIIAEGAGLVREDALVTTKNEEKEPAQQDTTTTEPQEITDEIAPKPPEVTANTPSDSVASRMIIPEFP